MNAASIYLSHFISFISVDDRPVVGRLTKPSCTHQTAAGADKNNMIVVYVAGPQALGTGFSYVLRKRISSVLKYTKTCNQKSN